MWSLELFGISVQLILMISVIDIHVRSKFESKVFCKPKALADNLILIVSDNVTITDLYSIMDQNKTSLTGQMLINGVVGKTLGKSLFESHDGLLAIGSGFERGPFQWCNQNQQSVFSNVKVTYFGEGKLMRVFDTRHWNIHTCSYGNISDNILKYFPKIEKETIIFMEMSEHINGKLVLNLLEKITIEAEKHFNRTAYLLVPTKSINKTFYNFELMEATFAAWGSGFSKKSNVIINQIDLNSIITSILGLSPSKRSIGTLPYQIMKPQTKEHLHCNALHLKDLANSSFRQVRLTTKFTGFFEKKHDQEKTFKINSTLDLLQTQINESLVNITYSKKIMGNTIFYLSLFTYIEWILLLISHLLSLYLDATHKVEMLLFVKVIETPGSNTQFFAACFLTLIIVTIQQWPIHYWLYFVIPIVIFRYLIEQTPKWMFFSKIFSTQILYVSSAVGLAVLVESEYLFWSMRNKYLIFCGFLIIMLYYVIMEVIISWTQALFIGTGVSGLFVILLFFLPPLGVKGSQIAMYIGGPAWICAGVTCVFLMKDDLKDLLTMCLSICHFITTFAIVNLLEIQGPSFILIIITLILITIAPYIPVIGSNNLNHRLLQLSICLGSAFILFSNQHELTTVLAFTAQYYCWYLHDNLAPKTPFIERSNVHYSFFFIIIIYTIMPAIGFEESFSQIDFSFIRRISNVECSFLSTFLLLLKNGIILILLFCIFSVIYNKSGEGHFILALIILNLTAFRYFIDLSLATDYKLVEKQFLRYCYTQATIIILIVVHSFIQLIVFCNISQFVTNTKNMFTKLTTPTKEETKETMLSPYESQ